MGNVFLQPDLIERPTKRVIIAGSRGYSGGIAGVARAVAVSQFDCELILCGRAQGADTAGELWARLSGIPTMIYPANWRKYGKSAGHRRNQQMADNADALIALWDGESPGTRDMIRRMESKPTIIYWEEGFDGSR